MTTKERIEKEARLWSDFGHRAVDAYIAGATAEHERMAEQLHRYKNAVEIKDRQLKQERNKAIDECCAELENHNGYSISISSAVNMLQNLKALESPKFTPSAPLPKLNPDDKEHKAQ